MAINKIVLEKDGLVVGSNQLVASGNGIYIGNNLVVAGNTYLNNLSLNNLSVNGIDIVSLSSAAVGGIISNSVVMTGLYNSGNTITNASGLINNISQGYLTVSNIVYNNNGLPTSFVETYLNTNYAYTVSYYSNNDIATITRV